MRCGPVIQAFIDVRRVACLPRVSDEFSDQALFDRIVDLRKAHHHHVDAALQQRLSSQFRGCPGIGMLGVEVIFIGRLTRCRRAHRRGGSDQQRALRTGQRLAQCGDGPGVFLAVVDEVGEVVIERGVNDRIALLGAASEAGEVFKGAVMRLGADGP